MDFVVQTQLVMEDKEEWRDVIGFDGKYMVSSIGNVKSKDKVILSSNKVNGEYKAHRNGKVFSKNITHNQYYRVTFSINNNIISKAIHTLVAESFIPNPQQLPYVNHKDGNKLNNRVENLEWCTASQNTQHAYDTGLMSSRKGEQNHRSILKEVDIPIIRQLGDDGVSFRSIAKLYGCSDSAIQDVIHKRTWDYIL